MGNFKISENCRKNAVPWKKYLMIAAQKKNIFLCCTLTETPLTTHPFISTYPPLVVDRANATSTRGVSATRGIRCLKQLALKTSNQNFDKSP